MQEGLILLEMEIHKSEHKSALILFNNIKDGGRKDLF